MRTLLLSLFAGFLCQSAQAFNVLKCTGDLPLYAVHVKPIKKIEMPTSGVSLTKKESLILEVTSESGEKLLTLYPWDGISWKDPNPISYKVSVSADNFTWFRAKFTNKKTKKDFVVNCRFTFE